LADPGTIRSDFSIVPGRNVIHGSDSPESADRELRLWFDPTDDVINWHPINPQVEMLLFLTLQITLLSENRLFDV
jgi:hypothetical protein